jgi:hypothetical protein
LTGKTQVISVIISNPKGTVMLKFRNLALLALSVSISPAYAQWDFPSEPQGRAEIRFTQDNQIIFSLACAHNEVLQLRYPGLQQPKTRATIVISNAKARISIDGSVERDEDTGSNTYNFVAVWTGRGRQPANQNQLQAVLFSGQELTISAENSKYVLPGMDSKISTRYQSDC